MTGPLHGAPADRDWRNNWRGPREPDAGPGEYEPATSGSPGASADRERDAAVRDLYDSIWGDTAQERHIAFKRVLAFIESRPDTETLRPLVNAWADAANAWWAEARRREAVCEALRAKVEQLIEALEQVATLLTFEGRGYAPAATKSNEAREVAKAALGASA